VSKKAFKWNPEIGAHGIIVTVPDALELEQPVVKLVAITLYCPEFVAIKDATLPGLATPEGAVQE
jgi:hypothetical protein